jgi:hypothetical protein
MSAALVLIMLLCLALSGCAGLGANDTPPQPRAVLPPPDGKKLAELVSAAFKTAKLPGAPEVSPVHAAHDAQWGDWIFCIKSSDSDQLPKYAVLIGDNTILEVRSFVSIDGCDKETYHPIEISGQHGNLDGSHVDIPPQSRRRKLQNFNDK